MRQPGCGQHLFVGGVRPAKADVVRHGVTEQERVLQHDANLLAQAGGGHIGDADAVNRDLARAHPHSASDANADGDADEH